MDQCYLIIDTRENYIIRHTEELSKVNWQVKQITIGDFAVVSPSGKILTIIERKTLTDYAASIKDGRIYNREKMLKLKESTGCNVMFIIEGKKDPPPDKQYAGITYQCIESSILHMIIRDNITVLYTKDSLSTAQLLCRFVKSMNNMLSGKDEDTILPSPRSPVSDIVISAPNSPVAVIGAQDNCIDLLTTRQKKTDIEIARKLWACFAGISIASADEYLKHWPLYNIICGLVTHSDIDSFKLSTGRSPRQIVIQQLKEVPQKVQVNMLAEIPGISRKSAEIVLSKTTLSCLLFSKTTLAEVPISQNRKIGKKLANNIIRYFEYTPSLTQT